MKVKKQKESTYLLLVNLFYFLFFIKIEVNLRAIFGFNLLRTNSNKDKTNIVLHKIRQDKAVKVSL